MKKIVIRSIVIAFLSAIVCFTAPQVVQSATVVSVEPGGTFVNIASFQFSILDPPGTLASTFSVTLPSGWLNLTDTGSSIVSALNVGSNELSGQIASSSINVLLGNWVFGNQSAVSFVQNVDYFITQVGTNYVVSGTSAVPLPAAVWLLGSGLVGLVAVRRRQKK